MKFPKRIKARKNGPVLASIYPPSASYPSYRLVWRVNGQRRMEGFRLYGDAKRKADTLVKDLAKGSQVTALTPMQATDALAALEKLQGYFQAGGPKVSLLAAASEYVEAAGKLRGHTLGQAVDGFLRTVANVKRMSVAQAVEDFINAEEPRTISRDGKRPELSPKYHYNRAIMLRRFTAFVPENTFEDLTQAHLDKFFKEHEDVKGFTAKSRNHHRAAIRQLLLWAVRKDYLSPTHRLAEADSMRPEHANNAEAECYTAIEFRALLDAANGDEDGALRAMIAIGGLAGLRTEELRRLTWQDVWKVEGHIEITAGKSKTRQRRLVEIVPALAQWIAPFKDSTGKIWTFNESGFQKYFRKLCAKAKIKKGDKEIAVTRKPNGLRHSFCSYHFAKHGNENLTAQQAGNSPAMIHGHYKGLATKKEGEAWFAVSPDVADNVINMNAADAG